MYISCLLKKKKKKEKGKKKKKSTFHVTRKGCGLGGHIKVPLVYYQFFKLLNVKFKCNYLDVVA